MRLTRPSCRDHHAVVLRSRLAREDDSTQRGCATALNFVSYERMEQRYAQMGAGDQLAKVRNLLASHDTTVEASLASTIASLSMPALLLNNVFRSGISPFFSHG